MSRTIKGSKSIGSDYWTARPGNKGGGGLGPFYKRQTHRAERRINNQEAKHAFTLYPIYAEVDRSGGSCSDHGLFNRSTVF